MSALAKEDGSDEDMAEMIAYEIDSLSDQLKEVEEKLKVFHFVSVHWIFHIHIPFLLLCFVTICSFTCLICCLRYSSFPFFSSDFIHLSNIILLDLLFYLFESKQLHLNGKLDLR
jgi:hypothetical protein